MKTPIFIIFFWILSLGIGTFSIQANDFLETSEKTYAKEYYNNGQLKAEGWQYGDLKTDFWIFYYPNGTIASKGHFSENAKNGYWHYYNEDGRKEKEGHYVKGSAENWWIFYDIANQKTSKFQFKNNKKNGFSLRYEKKKLIKAEKYTNNIKEDEWTSIIAFRRDNPGVSLR